MAKTYRSGAAGALMDEYERAVGEFSELIGTVSDAEFEAIRDRQTQDEDCRSIQTIVNHVVRAGYGYADYIRAALSIHSNRTEVALTSPADSVKQLALMIDYTVATLEGRWQMPEDQMSAVAIESRWGTRYDLEQMLEHAIVHVLRHRRQIERFLNDPFFSSIEPPG
jgi:uncharacterized damage-inducible protein DinB